MGNETFVFAHRCPLGSFRACSIHPGGMMMLRAPLVRSERPARSVSGCRPVASMGVKDDSVRGGSADGSASHATADPGQQLAPTVSKPARPKSPELSDLELEMEDNGYGKGLEFSVLGSSALVGIATGLAVVIFNMSVHSLHEAIFDGINLTSGGAPAIMGAWETLTLILAPAAGGLVVSALRGTVGGFDSEPRKDGKQSPHSAGGIVPERLREPLRPVLKAISATVTLGTGASLGPEGPSVEIGKAIAKGVGKLDRAAALVEGRMTSILAAGAAAGVAAGFNAAISGVFFSFESVLATKKGVDAEEDASVAIVMVLLAAVMAAAVVSWGLGSEPAFRVPRFDLRNPLELPLFFLLGTLSGTTATAFHFTSRAVREGIKTARKKGLPSWTLPAIGGLATGLVATAFPEITYQGFVNVDAVLASGIPGGKAAAAYTPVILFELVLIKICTTALARETGQVGGVFAPSIFMGAALGTGFGKGVQHAVQPLIDQIYQGVATPPGAIVSLAVAAPQSYALVGVAAMLASVCRVPLTSILLIFELTRNYTAIVPACGAVGLSYFISYQGERIVDAYFDREARLASSERASPLGKDLVVAPPSIRMALSSGVSADGLGGPWGASARAEGQDWESLRARLLEAGAGGKPVTSALSRDVVVVRESEDLKGALAAMEGAGQGMAVVVGNDGTFRGVVSADEVRSSLMVLGAGRGEAGPG